MTKSITTFLCLQSLLYLFGRFGGLLFPSVVMVFKLERL